MDPQDWALYFYKQSCASQPQCSPEAGHISFPWCCQSWTILFLVIPVWCRLSSQFSVVLHTVWFQSRHQWIAASQDEVNKGLLVAQSGQLESVETKTTPNKKNSVLRTQRKQTSSLKVNTTGTYWCLTGAKLFVSSLTNAEISDLHTWSKWSLWRNQKTVTSCCSISIWFQKQFVSGGIKCQIFLKTLCPVVQWLKCFPLSSSPLIIVVTEHTLATLVLNQPLFHVPITKNVVQLVPERRTLSLQGDLFCTAGNYQNNNGVRFGGKSVLQNLRTKMWSVWFVS